MAKNTDFAIEVDASVETPEGHRRTASVGITLQAVGLIAMIAVLMLSDLGVISLSDVQGFLKEVVIGWLHN